MALVPGEGSTVPNIASGIGSGIDIVTTAGGVDNLSAFLVAGGGISITPSAINKSITIAGVPGPAGVSVITSPVGSGIQAVEAPAGTVTLTGQYIAGTGLQMVPSGVNNSVTINNTQTISSQNGSGVKLIPSGNDTDISVLLQPAGPGISITPDVGDVGISIGNTGVVKALAGSGVAVSSATGNVTFSNTGVTGVVAGAGVSVSAPTGNVTIGNTGVTSLVAGSGITLSGSTGAVTVSASPAGAKSWQLVDQGGGFFTANSYIIFKTWNTGGITPNPFPTNDPTPIFVQMSFTNITYQGPFGDPYVGITGGNTGAGLITPTNTQWTATYQNPPTSQPYTWTYQFMVPPGNLGQQIILSAVSASMTCNCNYTVWMYY